MIAATPRDLAEGQPVASGGKTRCWETEAVLREGDEAVIHFHRRPDSDGAWTRAGVYHPAAVPDITGDGEEPMVHLLARGRLAVCSDCATQEATLRLVDVDPVSIDDHA